MSGGCDCSPLTVRVPRKPPLIGLMVIISDPVAVLAFGGSSDVPFKVAATVQLAHGAWNAGRSGGLAVHAGNENISSRRTKNEIAATKPLCLLTVTSILQSHRSTGAMFAAVNQYQLNPLAPVSLRALDVRIAGRNSRAMRSR